MHTLDKLIDLQRLNIAIENEGDGFYNNFLRTFKSSLFGRMTTRVSELFANRDLLRYGWVPRLNSDLLIWADRETYMVLGDVKVFIPVGLKVNYLTYLDALEGVLPMILKIEEELLDPAINTIGVLINNPAMAASKSGLNGTAFNGKLFKIKPTDNAKPVSACFDPNSREDTAKYKDVIRRNADLQTVVERLAQLQDNLPLELSARIEKKIRELLTLTDQLVEQIKTDERYKALSPKIGVQVSDQLYQCALWVEWYAVYQRQVLVLSNAVKDTVQKLEKLAKK